VATTRVHSPRPNTTSAYRLESLHLSTQGCGCPARGGCHPPGLGSVSRVYLEGMMNDTLNSPVARNMGAHQAGQQRESFAGRLLEQHRPSHRRPPHKLCMHSVAQGAPGPISAATGLVMAIFWLSPPPISSVTGDVMATLALPPPSGARFLPKMNPAICGGGQEGVYATNDEGWGRGVASKGRARAASGAAKGQAGGFHLTEAVCGGGGGRGGANKTALLAWASYATDLNLQAQIQRSDQSSTRNRPSPRSLLSAACMSTPSPFIVTSATRYGAYRRTWWRGGRPAC
jgi:hypothetical protein